MIKLLLQFLFLMSITTAPASATLEEDMTNTANSQSLPALRELYKRAEAGDADYQLSLGNLFYKGVEVTQDFNEAIKWFRLAAEQGHPDAQLNLGILYAAGQVVAQDNIEAVKWFRLAADQDNPQAQFNLGMLYNLGQGVEKNQTEAVKWYRLAAKQGLSIAQLNLGVAYVTGQGVVIDEKEALNWLHLAADQNEAQAQFNLGVMYANGQGVDQDLVESYRWAKLAAAQGHETAGHLLENLKEAMTPQQLALANNSAEPAQIVTESLIKESMPGSKSNEIFLQLGAFKTEAEAESHMQKMKKELGNLGKPYSLYTYKEFTRVHLGPYTNKVEARRIAAKIKEKSGFRPLLKTHE